MPLIRVEVVYALPERQTVVGVEVEAGTSVREAIVASGVLEMHPEINLAAADFGVWNERVEADCRVRNGDRVEIYRALIADPKAMRRQRASLSKSGQRRRKD